MTSLKAIETQIGRACAAAGRSRDAVTLVAVSKQQPDDAVESALAEGLRVFGENRVQEAKTRWSSRRAAYPDLQLHLIGGLQTNKVRDAVALFDVIQTVDSEKLAAALAAEMKKQNRPRPCMIQVNTGAEAQKGGVAPENAQSLLDFCNKAGLTITGLMCIPPADAPPETHFLMLSSLAKRLGLAHLSMGMSADFDRAIQCGATHIRVGSALFGERHHAS